MSAGAGKFAEFLASVGFKADENSLKSALSRVAAFGATMQLMAAGVTAGIMRVAESQVAVARDAENMRTSTQRLEELRYVAEQTGASTGALDGALKALGEKYPRIKDTSVLFERMGDRMRGMTEEQQKAYAKKMGIDPALIPMLAKDVSGLSDEFRQMYALAGTDAKGATESSKGFLAEIGKLKTLAETLAKAVSLAFIGRVRGDLEQLRRAVMENFGAIRTVMEFVIGLVLRISGVISAFVYRAVKTIGDLVRWFDRLDGGTKKLILGAGALLAAWRLLNLGFLATPLGAVVLALAGLVGLIDDYLTYMEGGESYFDWGPYVETIEAARAAIGKALTAVGEFVGGNQEMLSSVGKAAGAAFMLRKGLGAAFDGMKLLSGGVKTLGTALKANLLGLLLYLAVTLAVLLIQNWDKVKAKLADFWQWLTDKAAAAGAFLKGLWADISESFPNFAAYAESWIEAIKNFGRMLVAVFSGDFAAAGEYAQAMFGNLGDMALAALSGLGQTILAVFSRAWDGVREAFPDFAGWAEGAAASLTGILGKAVDWIRDKLAALVEWMPDWAKDKLGLSGKAPAAGAGAGAPPLARTGPDRAGAPALAPGPAQAAAMSQNSTNNTTLNAKTEIHMHTADPIAAGNQAAAKQGQVNAEVVRNVRPVAK